MVESIVLGMVYDFKKILGRRSGSEHERNI